MKQGRWIAKLATQNQDQSMRITPLTYGMEGAEIVFSTWENGDRHAARVAGRPEYRVQTAFSASDT